MNVKKKLCIVLCLVITASLFAAWTQIPASATSTGSVPVASLADSQAFEDTISWDAEYDVVVVGFGGAGAVASITASDAGARTLLLEKAPKGEEGGNSRYACQIIMTPTDREKAITYFKALRGSYTNQSDKIIETIVDGSMGNKDWLLSMGMTDYWSAPLPEYPELPGADGIGALVIDKEMWTSKFYALVRNNVEKRAKNLEVWYSSPGKELIQDPETKIIHGIKVDMQGKMVNVRAKNGIVLACGGFENNLEMIQNYTQMPYAYSKGAHYNDGDGITMAMRVGADLWHMSTLSGPDVGFREPDTDKPRSFGYAIQNVEKNSPMFMRVPARSVIFVGSDGTRFTNEAKFPRHGHVNNSGTWVSMQIPTPAYMVFDETARLEGPLYPSWSRDNSEELAKGWLIKADTIAELAEKINVNATTLEAQIEEYNQYCEDGVDPIFGREAEFLKPVSKGPYYSMELAPFFTNTQGGPKRNENCEILDVDGNTIPHLYSAGELGSFYCDIYNIGGNLAECIFSGRIAGENAAEAKTDIVTKSVMGGKTPVKPAKEAAITAGSGELLGEGRGIGGTLTVTVKISGDKISDVKVVKHNETAGIADKAIAEIPAAIVKANSAEVDSVSGATVTSEAIKEAVINALAKK